VVVVMMENRSFDHYLGSLSLTEGRTDIDGLTAEMQNPSPDGSPVFVYREDLACFGDPPHSWNSSHAQFNSGANNGFVKEYHSHGGGDGAHRAMCYLERDQLPVLYSLADQFTVCDQWYSSVMGPTWPNRFYSHGAQSSGEKFNNVDGDYSFETIYHRLYEAGYDYAAYYNNISFMMLLTDMPGRGRFRGFEEFHEDALAGKLPNYSVVEPHYGRNCDHPPVHPMAGQLFLASVLDSLSKSPQWERSLVIITYDEHGGFFDHVPPPRANDNFASEGFDQLGFRVPSLVVGPYVKERYASHMVYDHSSILAFLEKLWDLSPLTERDRAANDLFDALDMERIATKTPRPAPTIPVVEATEEELYGAPCGEGYKTGGAHSPASGQSELEIFIDEVARHAPPDRRDQADALYEQFVTSAESRQLLKRRS
ncbi:MAG: alkaline phosphatase family protein, partial [Myxococcota bacterium]|nr:alkaline phosphatase family protein [Myxococcota bacterium]